MVGFPNWPMEPVFLLKMISTWGVFFGGNPPFKETPKYAQVVKSDHETPGRSGVKIPKIFEVPPPRKNAGKITEEKTPLHLQLGGYLFLGKRRWHEALLVSSKTQKHPPFWKHNQKSLTKLFQTKKHPKQSLHKINQKRHIE